MEPALLLVLIIFAWTPPHGPWPARKDEYEDIAMPMLPVTHGEQYTKWHIFFYTLIMVATTLPFAIGMSGWLYLAAAIALGLGFLYWSVVLLLDRHPRAAMAFRYSILFNAALSGAVGRSLLLQFVAGARTQWGLGMNAGIRNTLLGCFAFMALMLGLFTNNMFREPVLSDAELREKGIVLLPQPRGGALRPGGG